ncbi:MULTISPECIES: hypothetical protein [unclassified Veillonella]|uniref:hypothetical protein n=1 Tax=unclassified Veillonella TaxID=2630086 RepID=UPI000F8F224D|nr:MULTISPECIES: hypothetical protein [unclassified Veillonella]
MKANWKATIAAMAVVGLVGLQPQLALGEDASSSTIHKQAESVVSEQDTAGNSAVEKNVETAEQGKTVLEMKAAGTAMQRKVTVGTVTLDLTPNHVAEDMAVRKFLQEKKASFVEDDEENLELVGTTFTAKRIPELVITDTFVNALKEEAKARVEAKQREPWTFPDVDVLKEKLEAIGKKKPVDTHASEMLDADGADDADDVTDVGTTRKKDSTLVGHDSLEAPSEVENTAEKDSSETAKESNHSKADSTVDHKVSDKVKKPIEDKKDSKDAKQSKAPKYPIELLWTDKANIFLHEDVHVGATRSEVLFAWGAPQAMWRDNKDGSLLWLYRGMFGEEKTITKNKKSSMQKEEFSHSVKNTYTSDSLAGSNSSVGYVWLSLKDGKVTHLGMITGQDWPRFAIPATTLETFKPNTMTESDFSLMGYRLGDTFTNDPNRSWEERGKLYGQEFLGYKDVVIAYNKEHEITRVMINSSLGTTKRGISLGDSKYLLLYLYGVPDFEEPANHHDSTKGVVYGYRHPVLEHTYLLFTLDDKFVREILLSNQKKSELVSAM